MSASVRVNSRTDNVAGVKLPVFNQYETGVENSDNLGLTAGGRKIAACRDRFGEYLKALIKIASLQTSFIAMDEALKITNRRVNALENVTLPKISQTIDYINRCVPMNHLSTIHQCVLQTCKLILIAHSELDELEREDFTRLKMVKKKKEEQIKVEAKAKLERQQANAAPVSAASQDTAGLRAAHPQIDVYVSPSRDASSLSPVRKSGSGTSSSPLSNSSSRAITPASRASTGANASSARNRGLEDLEDDGDDVVFK